MSYSNLGPISVPQELVTESIYPITSSSIETAIPEAPNNLGTSITRLIESKIRRYNDIRYTINSASKGPTTSKNLVVNALDKIRRFVYNIIDGRETMGDPITYFEVKSKVAGPSMIAFVNKINRVLISHGLPPVANRGEWTQEVASAVENIRNLHQDKNIQGSKQISAMGDVDLALLSDIDQMSESLDAIAPSINMSSDTPPTLKKGDTGSLVSSLIVQLNKHYWIPISDQFDSFIEAVVKDYQMTRGIFPNGVVDLTTWNSLQNDSPGATLGTGDAQVIREAGLRILLPEYWSKLPNEKRLFVNTAVDTAFATLGNPKSKIFGILKPYIKILLRSIAYAESSFNPSSIGDVNNPAAVSISLGLFQINKKFIDQTYATAISKGDSIPVFNVSDAYAQGYYLGRYLQDMDRWIDNGYIISDSNITPVNGAVSAVLNDIGLKGKVPRAAAIIAGTWRTGASQNRWRDVNQTKEVASRTASFALNLG